MDPWYRIVTPRKEVREGRSFNPDEFAIALEQVVAGTAPEDYRKPELFFARTCFTQALREHVGMILRRLSGQTSNTAPVTTLVTQFGGGKTHTLTSLYHLARAGEKARSFPGVSDLLFQAGVQDLQEAAVGVFVGNAWDPRPGRETPWLDLARQIAGDKGAELLGTAAKEKAPGTESLQRVFEAAGKPVLVLCDEVLNFTNRHRDVAEPFHAFIQNLTVAMTGTPRGAAVISLPRSQVEMTDWDREWQDKITKVVRRVAKDLFANDEAEISEVIRRRLFENLGDEKIRRRVAKQYAQWCFERRAQLPREWMDVSSTEKKAQEYLQGRFEACYPFHPATLSVFQRKWQPLPHFQQTRGTLAMLAQWVSWAFGEHHRQARNEPLLTLGSAPLGDRNFRAVVLGQLGESRLDAAILADIAGEQAHARALDADAKGPLKDIHRRVATAILFESSGGQRDKVAHLPELRFAIGEPGLETTSVDNAAHAVENAGFFIQPVGSDGFKLYHKAKIDKAMHDRKASLDEQTEVLPAMRRFVEEEFERRKELPMFVFPKKPRLKPDPTEIEDTPRLMLVVLDPSLEWGGEDLRANVAEWTKRRGKSDRLYPGAIVWCARKAGRDYQEKVETLLAWQRVQREVRDGLLGADYEKADFAELQTKVKEAEADARDEVWASYRYAILADAEREDGLRVIDLGAGHASSAEGPSSRVMTALRSEGLLDSSIGAGYIDRKWPPAFKDSGAWPLSSLRQAFLNGALTRLPDPDAVLRSKLPEFVLRGDFGLAWGRQADGSYERVRHKERVDPAEIDFRGDVVLLKGAVAERLTAGQPEPGEQEGATSPTGSTGAAPVAQTTLLPPGDNGPLPTGSGQPMPPVSASKPMRLRVRGVLTSEIWNRFGTRVLPKLRGGEDLRINVELSVTVDPGAGSSTRADLTQALADLGIADAVQIDAEQ